MTQDEYNEAWGEGYKDGVKEILKQLGKPEESKIEYKKTMTEADYERALALLAVAERDVAEFVMATGDEHIIGVAQALSEALTLLGVKLLEVRK